MSNLKRTFIIELLWSLVARGGFWCGYPHKQSSQPPKLKI